MSLENTAILADRINKRTTLDYLVITAADAYASVFDAHSATMGSSYGIMVLNSAGLIIK